MRWWLIVVVLAGLLLAAWVVYEDTRDPLACASLMADRAASPDANAVALDENATRNAVPDVASMLDAAVANGHGTVPTNAASRTGYDYLTHHGWTGPDHAVTWRGQTVNVRFSTC